jgi:hypothetical protein
VRYAPGELSNRFHLLGLPQGIFGLLALRDHFPDAPFEIFVERTQFGFGAFSPGYIDRGANDTDARAI